MFNLLVIIELIVSALLMIVVLMQSSKGGGLAGTFGTGSVGMVFGVRRTADFLTRATQVLAGTLMVLALLINIFFLPRIGSASSESVIQSRSASQPPAPTPQLPPTQTPTEAPATGK